MNPMTDQRSAKHSSFYVLTIGIIVLLLLAACSDDNQPSQNSDDSAIIRAEFSPKTHYKQHKISAFVQAVEQAQLAFQVSGRLSEQYVEIGQQVNKGQALLALYNPALAPQIDRIQSQIEANQANLNQTLSELERNQSLSAIQAISQNQLDRLSSRVQQLKSQQETLQAELQAAQNNLKEATLTAPFAGEVADIMVKPGAQVQAGQAVIVFSGSNLFEAPLYVSHALLKQLQINQDLTAHNGPDKWIVTVKEISRSANPASQLFKVLVSLTPNTTLLAGQKIDITIPEPIDNIYQLPVSAVIDDGINEPYVYVLNNEQLQHQAVQVVAFDNNHIWVRFERPQTPPLTVVTAGQSTLTPPQKPSES